MDQRDELGSKVVRAKDPAENAADAVRNARSEDEGPSGGSPPHPTTERTRGDGTLDPNLWAIVLAAGEGNRLASVTRRLYGHDLPKQFAALNSDRTLLQQTMDRVGAIVPPARTVVVIARNRQDIARSQLADYAGVQIISQPANVGTGPGVLLPLSLVKAQCPEARVVVTPSDHYIPARATFLAAVRKGLDALPASPAGLAVLGAEADGPAVDLGWIVPEHPARAAADARDVDLVSTFVEKPPLPVATDLFRRGGLWNTLVVVGSARALWRQAAAHMPRQTALFDTYVEALARNGGRPHAAADSLLARLYTSMPPADFSRAILENARGLAVVKLRESGWCDCGTPERLLTCLDGNANPDRRRLLKAVLHSLRDEEQQHAPLVWAGHSA
jgi:mannose-1-phosphate guanylyltransferase